MPKVAMNARISKLISPTYGWFVHGHIYQYVLSKDVVPPFSLYLHTLLILSVLLYGDVLVVALETPSWDQNILVSDKAVSVMVHYATYV